MTTGAIVGSLVQDAVFDTLNVAGFTSLATGGFYTDVPQGTGFPLAWLTFDPEAEDTLQNRTFGRLGAVSKHELHVYSLYEGDDQAVDLFNKAAELLHEVTLTVTGWSVPYVSMQNLRWSTEDYNGQVMRHGILPFHVHAVKN